MRALTRWLRGDASVHPHGHAYVRVWMERPGLTGETYITHTKAKQIHSDLGRILARQTIERRGKCPDCKTDWPQSMRPCPGCGLTIEAVAQRLVEETL